MKHEETLQKFQQRSVFSTWVGVVLLFAFFALLALVVIGASPRGSTYEEKRAKARVEKLQAASEEANKALTTYAWVDKNKGVVRIPITDAMKLTVAELAEKKPVPANPIATPATVSPPAGAAPTAASPPSPAVKAPESATPSPSPAASATPVPAHGKTP